MKSFHTATPGRRTLTLARLGLIVASACAVGELLGGLGFRLGFWSYSTGIQIVRWSATLDLAVVIPILVTVMLALMHRHQGALKRGCIGLIIALAAGVPPFVLWRTVEAVPRIHDISTDTVTPPKYVAVLPLRTGLNGTQYTAETAAQQKLAYPDIAPAQLAMAPAQALQRAEAAVRAMGLEVVAVSPAEGRIEATDTSLLFGFKDDVVIRVTADGAGSRVDVRSLSRMGRSDFGVNAKRIRNFMRKLAAL